MCLWNIFRITVSKSLPIVDSRLLIGCRFGGNYGPYLALVRLSFLLLSKALGNKKAVVKPVALLEVA
jgi:hypothetical protein